MTGSFDPDGVRGIKADYYSRLPSRRHSRLPSRYAEGVATGKSGIQKKKSLAFREKRAISPLSSAPVITARLCPLFLWIPAAPCPRRYAEGKAWALPPSFSTSQSLRRRRSDWEVGNPEKKEFCFPRATSDIAFVIGTSNNNKIVPFDSDGVRGIKADYRQRLQVSGKGKAHKRLDTPGPVMLRVPLCTEAGFQGAPRQG